MKVYANKGIPAYGENVCGYLRLCSENPQVYICPSMFRIQLLTRRSICTGWTHPPVSLYSHRLLSSPPAPASPEHPSELPNQLLLHGCQLIFQLWKPQESHTRHADTTVQAQTLGPWVWQTPELTLYTPSSERQHTFFLISFSQLPQEWCYGLGLWPCNLWP